MTIKNNLDEDDDGTRTMVGRVQMPTVGKSPKTTACFMVISGSSMGKLYKLDSTELLIGRSNQCALLLEDDGVSRNHCRVTRDRDGKISIHDLQSTNGTFVNAKKIDSSVLNDGDRIQVGSSTMLKFSFQDHLEEEFQQKLYQSANFDGLTGVYNKRAFFERLEQECSYSKRQKQPFSLCMLDIDHFKRINDSFGHPIGDHALSVLASVIGLAVRTEDSLCRYGGEEFAIILRGIDRIGGLQFAERIRKIVEDADFSFKREGSLHPLKMTVSLGVASVQAGETQESKQLIERADRCLYRAKEGGRNRAVGE